MKNPAPVHNIGLKRHLLHLLLILSLGTVIYSNTFHAPFQLDDKFKIVENPVIKNLDYYIEPSEAAEVWRDHYTQFRSRIIGFFTFALNYKIHGLDVTGYHAFNLAVHLMNALLVYALVLAAFKTPFLKDYDGRGRAYHVAFFSGLIFVSHPIETQAVTYIVQRFASMATLFYLAAFLAYVRFRLATVVSHRLGFYALTLAFALLSLKTKEFAVTLPVTIALFDICFFKDSLKKRILYLVPMVLLSVTVPLSYMEMNKSLAEISRVQTSLSRLDYLFTQFTVMVTYIRLIFFPVNQNLDYDYPIYGSFLNPAVLVSFLFLLFVAAVGVILFIRSRHEAREMRLAAFGIFWFLITMVPESGLIPIVDVIFEHRVYLPSAGIFISVASCTFWLKNALGKRKAGQALIGMLALLIVIFAFTAHLRNYTWRSSVVFWEDAVTKSPNKARVHNNLGYAYGEAGMNDKAIKHFKTSLSLEPENAEVVFNLGLAYLQKGDIPSARIYMDTALRLDPENIDTRKFLEYIYKIEGEDTQGSEHESITNNP